jgi:hypothetical protein
MTLLSEYENSTNPDFRTKLIMALAHKVSGELATIAPGDPDNKYERYIMISRKVLNEDQTVMDFVARVAAQAGLSNASTDLEIQTAVDSAFDKVSKVFDPTVG